MHCVDVIESKLNKNKKINHLNKLAKVFMATTRRVAEIVLSGYHCRQNETKVTSKIATTSIFWCHVKEMDEKLCIGRQISKLDTSVTSCETSNTDSQRVVMKATLLLLITNNKINCHPNFDMSWRSLFSDLTMKKDMGKSCLLHIFHMLHWNVVSVMILLVKRLLI